VTGDGIVSVTTDYVDAVLRRARQPMEPTDFAPNWDDKPYRTKLYPGVTRVSLPLPRRRETGTLGDALRWATAPDGAGRAFDLESVSAMLLDSYGLIARRIGPTGNEDSFLLPWYEHATWGRGTASGGGLYSIEIYWVAGPRGPLLPGVYHYSPSHHALERLLSGDVAGRVRAAVLDAGHSDQFLVLSVKFWKNSFKYNTFCYHVVTMDLGTVLGTWALWSGATGRRIHPVLWFDEPACNRLLGLDGTTESVFGVVPLPWRGTVAEPDGTAQDTARVDRIERERSRTVVRFSRIEDVQAACLAESGAEPDHSALADALPRTSTAEPKLALPDADPAALAVDVDTALRDRRSSFGAFVGAPAVRLDDLATVLDVATATGRVPSEFTGVGRDGLTRLAVFATHVEGLAEGAYDYDATARALRPVRQEPVGRTLQWNYFLRNYNLEQAAATIAVIARPPAVIEALGDRGYRLSNADVGAMAQALYVGAAAARIGCGAVLGFDNVAIAEALRIDDTDEWPLLLVMIGNERAGKPTFDYRLD
jgi:SagB-type dehydrogenase family enzyme